MTKMRLGVVCIILILAIGGAGILSAEPQAETEEFVEVAPGVPRRDTLILDQIFRYSDPANFNFWIPGTQTPTRHSLAFETLWYVDQQTGEWINAVAAEKPIYNADFTQMTVNLRKGLYWSDGVEFTADDLVFTVETLMSNAGMIWGAGFNKYVDDVSKTDNYSVAFQLSSSNPRFHSYFTAQWNGCYMMPKHVWDKVDDPLSFRYSNPVVLGSYTQKDFDPQGSWDLWERREDWQRTPLGVVKGQPAPKFVMSIYYGPPEKTVLAMLDHQLDIIVDLVPEAFASLQSKAETVRTFQKDFPYVWQDELDCLYFGFNMEKPPLDNRDVRWALALTADAVTMTTQYVEGLQKLAALPQPPTPYHVEKFYKPLQPWLSDLQIEVGPGTFFKPYDNNVASDVAAWAREEGHQTAGAPKDVFGYGWWKYAPDVAEKLLVKNGFRRDSAGKWLLPDGNPWKLNLLTHSGGITSFRVAMAAEDSWRKFGIDVETTNAEERTRFNQMRAAGDFEVVSSWGQSIANASAFEDKWPFIQGYHSDFYKPSGTANNSNPYRIKSAALDRLIDEMAVLSPDSPKVAELSREFMKLSTENLFILPTYGFRKYVTYDEKFWTGFPTAENAYAQPSFWFQGGKFALPFIKQVKQ